MVKPGSVDEVVLVEEVDRQAVVLGQGGLVDLLLPSSATSAVCWISKLSSRVCFPVHGQVGSSPAGCHLARPLQEFVGWPLGNAHQFLKQASVSHSKLGMMGQNPSPSRIPVYPHNFTSSRSSHYCPHFPDGEIEAQVKEGSFPMLSQGVRDGTCKIG